MSYRVFVSAGEVSGDRHAAALIEALRERVGEVEVRGLGGDRLAAQGARLLARVEDLSVLGFTGVARRLPYFLRLMSRARREIEAWRPHLVLPVDYPGFNLRLSRAARAAGHRVAYYIAPQVWAWRRDRRPGIARAVDHLLVVFPFEEALFREAGIDTTFVGHPLLDAGPGAVRSDLRGILGIPPGTPLLALLPGSRPEEVRRILPPLLAGVRPLRDRGVSVAVSRVASVPRDLYAPGVPLWEGDIAALLDAADAALVASGTATLETGLRGVPMAVVYRTHPVNWNLARALVRLRTVGLVNIAAGGSRVPELLQGDLTPARITAVAEQILFDAEERAAQRAYLAPLRARLGGDGAAARAADVVARLLGAA